ncbi:helix-turn-helix transcriptional regulator [Ornithinimicrobium tianjinense]|uniref:DNA-binding response regulator n=1 Tax=Ornithinimicrobium tianjinense TaxID=1195761 RepID=A0A917F4Y3_9MICO|nr:response regulator transcription factor [Ornithinimicrobium tianjinense]GGF50778.1 DNA-binding response regulator [Ornithinimicrobium tianjinense]
MTTGVEPATSQTSERQWLLDVAVLDDCPLVLHGVSATLAPYVRRVRPVVSTTHSSDGDADVTLWDPVPGGESRSAALPQLLGQHRHGRLVLHSFHAPDRLVAELLAEGCSGYVDKRAASAELVSTVLRVGAMGPVAGRPRRAGEVPRRDRVADDHELSPRECQMLVLIADGLTNQCIALQTNLSANTVKTYIRMAYRKIGVTRRPDAVRWGFENGLGMPTPHPAGRENPLPV